MADLLVRGQPPGWPSTAGRPRADREVRPTRITIEVVTPLIDTFGRTHNNLRISVTDRCNIRCFYCMPENDVQFLPRQEILSLEEIVRFVEVAAGLGIDKLRSTGREPLVRKNLPWLM